MSNTFTSHLPQYYSIVIPCYMQCTNSSFGTNINSHAIVNSITQHGIPIFHASKTHLKPFLCRDSNLPGIIAVYKQLERFCIVGIAINDLNATVRPKLATEYLETYRHTCDYFYLSAKRFSQSALELKDIGLFDLTKMKVAKESAYLCSDSEFRANLMRGVQKYFKALPGEVEDPFQRTLVEF